MLNKIRGLTVGIVLFLFAAGALLAQTPRELRFNAWVPGILEAGDEQWFSVRPVQTGLVVVETSGDTDTFLEAYDAARNFIDENDDGGEDYNARLEILAEAGKNYLFKLRCYDDDESGPYQIRASFSPLNDRDLRLGAWVPGAFDEGETQWYSVSPLQAGLLTVETSGDLDTYLEAYAASGSVIAKDDDSGEGNNARLEIFVEAGRKYLFKLTEYNNRSGSYQIRASYEPIPQDTERNTDRSRAVEIRLGEAFPIFFHSPEESRWFRYEISRADTLFIVQTRGSLDTVMSIYDARGNLLGEDDDSGEGMNALISQRFNPSTIYIEVREYDGRSGRCTLHAETR